METSWNTSMVIEEMSEMVLIFDQEGKVLYGNRSLQEKLGYTLQELEENNLTRIFWQEFQTGSGEFASFSKEKLTERSETVMYRKNSSCFPVSFHCFSVGDGIDCLLAEDVTWRNNMDVRLRTLKEDEEINRKERNEFTANVTHELRTPVNGIKGHVLSLLNLIDDENQRKTLEIILNCCDNMSAIINNILDFSKMEAGEFTLDATEFDFYKLMDQVFSTHMAEIHKKELRFSAFIDENIPQFVIGDALRIGQILNNLLSNAVKFTLVGQISVDVSKTLQINDEVELFFMVKDTGIGVSKEDQDKLFQSFKQADASITRRFGGTGLGLSIAKQLVESMHGSIRVESEKGKGSCFSFNIKLRTSQNMNESRELSETFKTWGDFKAGQDPDSRGDFLDFGTDDNLTEIHKKMEKLVLSIELGSWDKAEMLAETVKALTLGAEKDMKRPILQLEMAIRKENYEKSMAAYEKLKGMLPGD